MGKIVIFGGTAEGRWLVEQLADRGKSLHYFAATEYGASLPPASASVTVHAGRLTREEMQEIFLQLEPDICLDATHPYAVEVSENILAACRAVGLECIRILRRETAAAPFMKDKLRFVASVEAAAEYLAGQEGRIFLTTGSRELEQFTRIPDYKSRCVARVLPLLQVMEKCHALGFEGSNLICMQGPFSEEMNLQMFREAGADWLVTKSSGATGGYREKCSAAYRLQMGIVVVGRPTESSAEGMEAEQVLELLAKRYGLPEMIGWQEESVLRWFDEFQEADKQEDRSEGDPDGLRDTEQQEERSERDQADHPEKKIPEKRRVLYLVAMGPGRESLLTGEAVSVLSQSDVLIGAERVVKIFSGYPEKKCYFGSRREEIFSYMQAHPEYRSVAVCFSGDIGFYSGSKGLRQAVEQLSEKGWEIVPVSGISSVIYFLNLLGKSWEQVIWMSCHGRQADPASCVRRGETVCTLLGDEMDVSGICEELIRQGLSETEVTVGSCLSYGEERIVTGRPQEFTGHKFDRLSLLLLEPVQLPGYTRE